MSRHYSVLFQNGALLSKPTNGLTECIRSRTANLFLATQTAVRPEDLFPSGAEEETDSVSLYLPYTVFIKVIHLAGSQHFLPK